MGSWTTFLAGALTAVGGSAVWDAVCHLIAAKSVRRAVRKRPARRAHKSV